MFLDFLYALRAQGVPVGTNEFLAFLQGMRAGLATDLDATYHLGRAILCRSEADFDGYDLAFAAAFQGMVLPADLKEKLEEWLSDPKRAEAEIQRGAPADIEDLLRRLEETLREQKERHDGGNRWVGTGGTSPFGNNGASRDGIRVGGDATGGRSAVASALERRWAPYREDRTLELRDLQVVLRALRSLTRDGRMELDVDETIDQTAKNAGEIEIVERPERKNRLKVTLLMDAGGSMAPHAAKVQRLFTAASRTKTFRSFDAYTFHNCVYGTLVAESGNGDRVPTETVAANWTERHRLIFVGDASMAPYELFTPFGWPGSPGQGLSGLDWLKRLKARCPAAIWLNPDPMKYWDHPTVSAIRRVIPMYELTVDGLKEGVKRLRAPR